MITKTTSAIYNDIMAGLSGFSSVPTISMDQLEDEVVGEYLQIIKEYSLRNMVPRNDLLMMISCIKTDCKSLDKCPCNISYSQPQMHFEIPQIVNDLAQESVEFIGSVDRNIQFKIYTNTAWQFHKFMRRGSDKPFVYIEPTPNENNKYDCWVYNAPMLKIISVIAIFKDPRQLMDYDCCQGDELENYTFISTEVKKRLTEKKLRYYRQLLSPPQPNNQIPR